VELTRIHIDDIQEASCLRLLSYGRDYRWLEASIQKVGLINPLQVSGNSDGRFQLICGLARLHALRALEIMHTDVIVRAGLDDLGSFEIALHDNLRTREFNDVELAGAVHFILQVLKPPERDSEKLLRLLSVPLNPKTVSRYIRLYDAADDMKRLLVRGIISFNTFVLMSGLRLDESRSILNVMETLKPGTNYQQELIYLCEDIATRQKRPIPDIFENSDIRSVLVERDLSNPDRVKRLFRALRIMRSSASP